MTLISCVGVLFLLAVFLVAMRHMLPRQWDYETRAGWGLIAYCLFVAGICIALGNSPNTLPMLVTITFGWFTIVPYMAQWIGSFYENRLKVAFSASEKPKP